MAEESTDKSFKDTVNRPFFLSIICIAIFVYAGFLVTLFLFGLIFNTWVTATLDDFFPEKNLISNNVVLISTIGFILNIASIIGAVYLWKLRKIGFYLYLLSNLIFIFSPFLIGYGNLYSASILILILLLIVLFLKKLK